MPFAPPVHRPRKAKGKAPSSRKSSAERGYDYRWQQARERFLMKFPLCAECEREGKVSAATEVDHIIPHRGDVVAFWDEAGWQGLCKSHHSRKTASGL